MRWFFLLFYFIFSISISFAQWSNLKFNHVSTDLSDRGLIVECMVQDDKGFLWIGTKQNGLCMYDGYKVHYVSTDAGDSIIPFKYVTSLKTDTLGFLWIGTREHGLWMYNLEKGDFHEMKHDGLEHSTVTDILVRKDARELWIASSKNIFVYNFTNDSLIEGHELYHLPGMKNVSDMLTGPEGKIWMACISSDSLLVFDPLNDSAWYFDYKKDVGGLCLEKDHLGNIWVGLTNGLIKLNTDTYAVDHYVNNPADNNSLSANVVIDIYSDSKGDIWIGTNKGLNRYVRQYDNFEVFYHDRVDPHSLSNSGVFSIFETRNKKLWVGTGYGLDKANLSFRFNLLRQGSSYEHSLWGAVIECLEPDSFGSLWVGTKTGGLSQVHLKTGRVKHHTVYNTQFIKDNHIAALFLDKNELWVATGDEGITIIDVNGGNGKPLGIKEHYSDRRIGGEIYDIHQDEELSSLYWLGTTNGLVLVDRRTGRFTRHELPDSLNTELGHVRVIREFDGYLWLGTTERGVWRMDKDKKTFLEYSPRHKKTSSSRIKGFFIKSLLIDDHLLWVGLLNGLACINMQTGEVENNPKLDELTSFSVMSIEKDDEGMLWLSTGKKGLVKLNPATMDYMVFGSQFGLNNYFMEDVSFVKDDFIYFGSAEGIVFFNPSELQMDYYSDPIVISSISVMNESFNHLDDEADFDKTIPYLNHIELSYDQNFVTFEYALLNFHDANTNEYACMLEGVESRWNHVGDQTSVSYQNLAPGHYVFRVIGKGPRGIWSAEPASLELTIRSPFWQTWGFRLSVLGVVLFLVIYLYFRRIRRMDRQQQKLEERVQERTAEVIEQKNILEDQRDKIEKQTNLLESQNKDMTDSIEYATKIQSAILPTPDVIDNLLPESFILFWPKAILSGDFYYIEQVTNSVFFDKEENNDVFFSAVDCTGHGVPGALMSIVGYMVLNQAIKEQHLVHTDEVLNFLDIEVKRILRRSNTGSRDGMDLALCKLDQKNMMLEYSGAFNNLYIIRDNRLIIYKAERNSIGSYLNMGEIFFKRHTIEIKKGDCIYVFSDGYPDQLGGISKTKKYSKRRFLNKLLEIHKMPMDRQQKVLEEELSDWMLGFEQMDDILVMGVRI